MFFNSTSDILSLFLRAKIFPFNVFFISFPLASFLKCKGSPAIDNRLYGFDILSPASFRLPLKKSTFPSLKTKPSFTLCNSSTLILSLLVKSFNIFTWVSPFDQISPLTSSLALALACFSSSSIESSRFLTSPFIYFFVFAQG